MSTPFVLLICFLKIFSLASTSLRFLVRKYNFEIRFRFALESLELINFRENLNFK